MSHVNVFAAADKYDVPLLRLLVADKFTLLMEQKWRIDDKDFCAVIERLCGPSAASFADASLQMTAAAFCSKHIRDLIKLEAFVSMLEKGEPFAGRLLTTVLQGTSDGVIKTVRCHACKHVSDDVINASLKRKCISCGNSGFGSPQLPHYKDFIPL